MATEITGMKISEAEEFGSLNGKEYFPAAREGSSGKVSMANIKSFVQPDLSGYAKKSDIPNTDGLLSSEEAEPAER